MPFRYALGPDPRPRELARALRDFRRVAICGAPETGKTTLADTATDRPLVHTDDWRDFPIQDQARLIVDACRPHEAFVIEGCLVARALRAGLGADVLLWLMTPMAPQTDKQKSFGKGLVAVFESIRETLAIPIVVIP
jgi:hypothetical protein